MDDIHEVREIYYRLYTWYVTLAVDLQRKFSFPIIYMIHRRRGKYQELLQIYKRPGELQMADLQEVGVFVVGG